jgi:hypothetical protein
LKKSIQGYEFISQAGKDRISLCFKQKQFCAGSLIIHEGWAHETAYIIRSGNCKLISTRNPYFSHFTVDGKIKRRDVNENEDPPMEIIKQGYMSKTTNSF